LPLFTVSFFFNLLPTQICFFTMIRVVFKNPWSTLSVLHFLYTFSFVFWCFTLYLTLAVALCFNDGFLQTTLSNSNLILIVFLINCCCSCYCCCYLFIPLINRPPQSQREFRTREFTKPLCARIPTDFVALNAWVFHCSNMNEGVYLLTIFVDNFVVFRQVIPTKINDSNYGPFINVMCENEGQ